MDNNLIISHSTLTESLEKNNRNQIKIENRSHRGSNKPRGQRARDQRRKVARPCPDTQLTKYQRYHKIPNSPYLYSLLLNVAFAGINVTLPRR